MSKDVSNTLGRPEFANGAALVIGGSGGIGASICRVLASSGSDVALSYKSRRAAADEVVAEIMGLGRNAFVNGCFNLISAVLPHLRERRRGSIVALVTGAVDRSPPRDILSAAPKAAIQMFIRGVAREEGRSGIRANCVGPGFIEAGLGLATIHDETQDYVAKMTRAIPLRRAGTPEDVADVVEFLLSDKARYVTGVTIPVAGGLQLA